MPMQSFPALFLFPTAENISVFEPKLLDLAKTGPSSPIGIRRACADNQEKLAKQDNGYFVSFVMSRQHADVWAEDGKVGSKCASYGSLVTSLNPITLDLHL